jgi:predicted ATPase
LTRRFVVTGAMGAGKSALLGELARAGFVTVPEPARAVIAEQGVVGGEKIYDRHRKLFYELMLERAIADFATADGTTFFDRGVPDLVAYAGIFGLDAAEAQRAAEMHRYDMVFVLPAWPEIYTTDDDRRMTFEQAAAFGDRVREVYTGLGYALVDVPEADVPSRSSFVVEVLEGTA